jgi:hypothetical protein
MDVRPLPVSEAARINAAIPVSTAPNPAAPSFAVPQGSQADWAQALECLTSAIYYEAGRESSDGQRAVAQVILNRVRHAAFPGTVCGVVYQGSTRATGCQFTFTCDGSLLRGADRQGWRRAELVARAALSGETYAPVGLATHYHATYVAPYWAPTLVKNAQIGTHAFYRWPGAWGRPLAFKKRYVGAEPSVSLLKQAALAAEAATSRLAATPVTAATGSLEELASGTGPAESPAAKLAALDLSLAVARRTLGPQHPKIVALQQESAAIAKRTPRSEAAQLAAVEARLVAAKRTLGPKHPEMIELQRQRDKLAAAVN